MALRATDGRRQRRGEDNDQDRHGRKGGVLIYEKGSNDA
jgi:hypothetical protein